MKQLKINPTKLIAMSVITIALSSCLGQTELKDSGFIVISANSEYSAGYTMEKGKLKELIPSQATPTFTYKLVGTYPINSLILDQRKSNRTTNWNYKNGNQIPILRGNDDNPSTYVLPLDDKNLYTIYSEPTTPALYNELCADTWNEPITNGELSKCWKVLRMTIFEEDLVYNPTYEDDMMKFSAFDNKLSYKPGHERSKDFKLIVDSVKKEVFATFTIGEELIPEVEYTANPSLEKNVSKDKKAEFVNINYNNGTNSYNLKIYKLNYLILNGTPVLNVYIVSTKDISSFETLRSIPDSEYANYAK
jgi:hypothetical protein